ncbi:OmpA family protein [Variovorax sp. dw_954]|uniref:OmpA family protein n=1 Tax=Variovorax sp. dw_954 TaxID=2720078 RepID=UPI001BD2FE78|nr:OmpA family protein [Variovorax sp. dw_954]
MRKLNIASLRILAGVGILALSPLTQAQSPGIAPAQGANIESPGGTAGKPEQVVAGGQVPDEATRAAVVGALRQVYGPANVIDRIEVVSSVGTPANWSANVQKLLNPSLKQIHRGQLQIQGTQITAQGEVGNEALRQKIVSDMAGALNPTYTIKNSLRVPVSEQIVVDQALGNRIIEFEVGSATLTAKGRAILEEIAAALAKLSNKSVAIIGHTDNSGNRASNLALSQARAEAVKGYLVGKGIDPATMSTSGVGPDQPVAGNDSDAGRARNRRIEFRVGR